MKIPDFDKLTEWMFKGFLLITLGAMMASCIYELVKGLLEGK
jgi:hypothetical protein